MIEWLSNLDISILTWINITTSNKWFDSFFPFYTDLHKNPYFAAPFVLLILFFFIKKYKRPGITYFIFLILSISTGDFFGSIIKNQVQRPRPYAVTEYHFIQRSPASPYKSFPSNHAMNTFGAANYISAFFPQAKIVLYTAAALVAYSRMYNGVHYPSDILAGALIGVLFAYIFSKLVKKMLLYFEKIKQKSERS